MMSSKASAMSIIMADRLAWEIIHENKGEVEEDLHVARLLDECKEKKIRPEELIEPEQAARAVIAQWRRHQTSIRRACEAQGDLFRPQMLIPVAPKVLAVFGTGGITTLIGYQQETTRKTAGAIKILERSKRITEFCTETISHLATQPTWDITRVRMEKFGYKLRPDDTKPLSAVAAAAALDEEEEDEDQLLSDTLQE